MQKTGIFRLIILTMFCSWVNYYFKWFNSSLNESLLLSGTVFIFVTMCSIIKVWINTCPNTLKGNVTISYSSLCWRLYKNMYGLAKAISCINWWKYNKICITAMICIFFVKRSIVKNGQYIWEGTTFVYIFFLLF